VGEVTSPCFRFKDVFAMAGVFVVPPDEIAGDDEGPETCDDEWACCCCGIVFSCFSGEFTDDGVV